MHSNPSITPFFRSLLVVSWGQIALHWRLLDKHRITQVQLQRIELQNEVFSPNVTNEPPRILTGPLTKAHKALAALAEGQCITIQQQGILNDLISLQGLSSFAQAVLKQTTAIPRGQTQSYGAIAKDIGHPHAARAVGRVQAQNPFPLAIPCHRVVRSDGHIGHYGAGTYLKSYLLKQEGVPLFQNNLQPLSAQLAFNRWQR